MASNVPNAPSDSSRGYESLGSVSAPRENDDPQGMTQDTQGPVARLTSSALDNLEDMPLNDKIAKFYSVQPGGLGGMMTLLHPQHDVSIKSGESPPPVESPPGPLADSNAMEAVSELGTNFSEPASQPARCDSPEKTEAASLPSGTPEAKPDGEPVGGDADAVTMYRMA